MKLGWVQSIEVQKKPVTSLRAKDGSASIKIINNDGISYGRHFDDSAQIVSMITRDSIDNLKTHFRDEMTKEDWQCCLKLKKLFDIV